MSKKNGFKKRKSLTEIVFRPNFYGSVYIKSRYPHISPSNGSCINRNQFISEFDRVLRIDNTQNVPFYLVIGSHTSVGSVIEQNLRKRGKNVIALRHMLDVDLSENGFADILSRHKIVSVIVVATNGHSPGGPPFASEFLHGAIERFATTKTKVVVIFTRPYLEHYVPIVNWYGFSSIVLPFFIEPEYPHDYDNSITYLVNSVMRRHPTSFDFYAGDLVHVFSASDLVSLVFEVLDQPEKSCQIVKGLVSPINVEETLEIISNVHFPDWTPPKLATDKHVIQFPNYCIEKAVGPSPISPIGYLESKIKQFKPTNRTNPYVSIIVPAIGRDAIDDIQRFLEFVEYGYKQHPLASFEVIIVDTDGEDDYEHDLGDIVHIVKCKERPTEAQTELHARNVGLQHSRGEFVLFTHRRTIIPPVFFHTVASETFNTAVVYHVISMTYKQSLIKNYDVERSLNTLLKADPSFFDLICDWKSHGATAIRSLDRIRPSLACGLFSFLLTSKDLMISIHGFDEVPFGENFELLQFARFMKFVPGFVFSSLPFSVFQRPLDFQSPELNHTNAVHAYICNATYPDYQKYESDCNFSSTIVEM